MPFLKLIRKDMPVEANKKTTHIIQALFELAPPASRLDELKIIAAANPAMYPKITPIKTIRFLKILAITNVKILKMARKFGQSFMPCKSNKTKRTNK